MLLIDDIFIYNNYNLFNLPVLRSYKDYKLWKSITLISYLLFVYI